MLQPIKFNDWTIVYSLGNNAQNDDKDADHLFGLLEKASLAFGVSFSQPGFIACRPNIDSWKKEIIKDV